LDQIIDMNHPLAKLARSVDWRFLEERFGTVYSDGPGQPPLPTPPDGGPGDSEAHAQSL
jgi:IS5 family transposase